MTPMNLDQARPIRLTCSRGLSEHLQAEVEALGYPVLSVHPTGVETEGTLHDAMRLNLHLRTAFHIQLELAAFRAREDAILASYAWVDKEHGIVRIPVEEAMRLVAERGVPFFEVPEPPGEGEGEEDTP